MKDFKVIARVCQYQNLFPTLTLEGYTNVLTFKYQQILNSKWKNI
jgi:hypothetical protein